MRMTLRDVGIGETVRITDIALTGTIRQRVMDMGITPGTLVTVRREAPLGDPIEIAVRGYALAMRKEDAAHIEVSSCG